MNFFTVGFVLLSLHINIDMPLNYALKLVGTLFMLGGIKEAAEVTDGFDSVKGLTFTVGAFSLGGLIGSILIKAGAVTGAAAKIISVLLGDGGAAAALLLQYKVAVKLMLPRHELVNDPSLLAALVKKWRNMAFFTVICMVCDVLQRAISQVTVQAVVGSVLTISKIIMLICVAVMGAAFNRVRMDFNVTHPI